MTSGALLEPDAQYDLKILLVDDGSLYSLSLLDGLKKLGYESIEIAVNGRCCLDYLKSRNVELIISNWFRREMSGLSLVELIKKHPAYASIPFIMLTHPPDDEILKTALDKGVDRFLPQPVDFNLLRHAIQDVTRKNQAHHK